jgi:hypothetical protein
MEPLAEQDAKMRANSQALPLLATLLTLVSFVFLNLDGYQLHLFSPWGNGDVTGGPPLANWAHGWPIGFAVRSSIYSVQAGRGVIAPSFTGEIGFYSRWPTDNAPVVAFSGFAAGCDLLLGLLLVWGTFIGTSKLVGYLGLKPRFSLRTLFVSVAAAAVLLAGREWIFASRYVVEAVAVLGVALGGCLSVTAMIIRPKRQLVAGG